MKAKEIRKYRQKLGLSQEEFAYKLGVSLRTLTRWESGTSKPSRMAQKLLDEIAK